MRQIVLLTALLGLSALNCSSSKTSGPEDPDPTTFCSNLAKAQCSDSVVRQCFGTSSNSAVPANDQAACIANRESACETTVVEPAQALGLTYDIGQAATCVHTTQAAYSDGSISSSDTAKIADDCGSVFSRMGAKNSVCTSDADCKRSDGLNCVIHPSTAGVGDAGTPEGTCQQSTTPIPGGNSCAAPDAVCVTGYHCGSTLHCDQDVAPGDPCSNVNLCVSTAKCGSNGVCVNKLADTSACTTGDDCQSGICAAGADICVDSNTFAPTDPFCTAMRQ